MIYWLLIVVLLVLWKAAIVQYNMNPESSDRQEMVRLAQKCQ